MGWSILSQSVFSLLFRSFNVLHILMQHGKNDLITHILKILPRDIVEALVVQQTKSMLNTVRLPVLMRTLSY